LIFLKPNAVDIRLGFVEFEKCLKKYRLMKQKNYGMKVHDVTRTTLALGIVL
jgi:hypothetical protein